MGQFRTFGEGFSFVIPHSDPFDSHTEKQDVIAVLFYFRPFQCTKLIYSVFIRKNISNP